MKSNTKNDSHEEKLRDIENYLILYALDNGYDPIIDQPISVDDIKIDNKIYNGSKSKNK